MPNTESRHPFSCRYLFMKARGGGGTDGGNLAACGTSYTAQSPVRNWKCNAIPCHSLSLCIKNWSA